MPELIPFIEMTGGQIAWNTQILIDMTYFFQTNYKKISITIISLIVLTVLIYRTKKGKYYIDKIKIRLPLIGTIFLYSSIIKFTKTLSVLLDSGVSIVPALESTSNVVGNEIIKETILNMANSVLAGDSLSTPISNAKNIFPHIVENLIKIGEQTGSIHNSLLTLSEIFNKMFQERVKLINIIMEPLLMLFLGFIVAFVAGSLISGILSSYGQF